MCCCYFLLLHTWQGRRQHRVAATRRLFQPEPDEDPPVRRKVKSSSRRLFQPESEEEFPSPEAAPLHLHADENSEDEQCSLFGGEHSEPELELSDDSDADWGVLNKIPSPVNLGWGALEALQKNLFHRNAEKPEQKVRKRHYDNSNRAAHANVKATPDRIPRNDRASCMHLFSCDKAILE